MQRMIGWVAIAATATVVVLLFLRLDYGVDLSDEAYYVTVGYRFSLGDRPFVDDMSLTQSFGIITSPLIRLFQLATGGSDGLVLFLRRAYLLFSAVVTATAFLALRARFNWPAALAVSLTCFAFVPFNIPNFSYNTLGSGLFTAGVFVTLHGVFTRPRPVALLGAGMAHALAVVAHPAFALPVGVFALALPLVLPAPRLPRLLAYAVGGVAIGLLAVGSIGIEELARAREVLVEPGGARTGRTAKLLFSAWSVGPNKLVLAGALGFVFWLGMKRDEWVVGALPLLPLLFAWSLRDLFPWTSSLYFMATWGLCAPLLAPFVLRQSYCRPLLLLVWLPSLSAGCALGWASSNAFENAGLGLAPAAVVGSLFLYEGARLAAERTRVPAWRAVPLFAPLLVAGTLLSFQQAVYMSRPLTAPRTRMDQGPFRGLHATTDKKQLLNRLSEDLRPLVTENGRILFYDHFPAGYLLSPLKPATPALFRCFRRTRYTTPGFCAQGYADRMTPASIAVWIAPRLLLGPFKGVRVERDASLALLIKQKHELVVERRDVRGRPLYRIYVAPE